MCAQEDNQFVVNVLAVYGGTQSIGNKKIILFFFFFIKINFITFSWCNFPEYVQCDNRTIINPDNPGNRTTTLAPTTVPTTVSTTVSTQMPNITNCRYYRDLFVGDTYLKSMCIFSSVINYEAGRALCQANNMNLFIIDDSIVQSVFQVATTDLLQRYNNGFVWINGRRDLSINQWNIFNADGSMRGRLYDGVNWVNTSTVDGRNSGECLRYSSQHGPYLAMGVACTTNAYTTCEHMLRTNDSSPGSTTPFTTPSTISTTTPSLITTTMEPNTGACWRTDDLINNSTQQYIKSLCVINTSRNYANSENFCRDNGMQLFEIDSSATQIAFRQSIATLLVAQRGGFLWINGRVDDECRNWYTFTPQRNLMFGAVHWVQTDTVYGRTSGDCLRFTSQHTPDWFAQGMVCTATSWSVCEYNQQII
jgi:hypothetical protein